MDLSKVFDQYLRDHRVPVFEYEITNGVLMYRWDNVIDGFDMPLEVIIDGENTQLYPLNHMKKLVCPNIIVHKALKARFFPLKLTFSCLMPKEKSFLFPNYFQECRTNCI